MNALRVIEKPLNGEIKISLPDNFNDDLVEVIILSLDPKKPESRDLRSNVALDYLKRSKKSSFDLGKFDAHEQ